MNKYVKEFCIRGLFFGSLGPIVYGIVMMILGFCHVEIVIEGWQIFLAILTTYILAFVQAGSSVFEQIEEWSSFKSALIHLGSIYIVYVTTYLLNSWIPLSWIAIVIFTAAIIFTFLIIWFICFLTNRNYKNKLNTLLK